MNIAFLFQKIAGITAHDRIRPTEVALSIGEAQARLLIFRNFGPAPRAAAPHHWNVNPLFLNKAMQASTAAGSYRRPLPVSISASAASRPSAAR